MRKLGEYIQQVDVRNTDLSVTRLLGLSINKCFIESIANTIGTDFRPYKIVKKGQFAYGPVTSRNGEKITIALLEEPECIISSSYVVFEITDTSKLLPEYLMLWFSRPEFDRYARYKSHGSVREIFDWDEMCRVELPVPPINEQQKIVDTYNAITNRIRIKQKINENILKQGIQIVQNFVGNAIYSNKTDSEIEEIKSSLPINQKMITIKEFCMNTKSGSTPSRTEIDYWKNGNIPWLKSGEVHNNVTVETEEYITKKATEETSAKLLPENTVLMAMYGVTAGEVGYLGIEATTNQAICGMICNSLEDAAYLYFSLLQNQKEISSLANGGAQNNLSKELIENLKLVIPENISELKLNVLVRNLILNTKELQKLNQLKQLVVSQISKR
ncbi:MAG: restriction endonuclease subunit S [Spirochaetaceae bacterium]|nr:restriction endonuclease subunit S [Spirochaetaceae bacterium]